MTGKTLPRRDPAAAQQMIDWLVVLEQKTRGNLTFEESDLLSRALYELRMAYVEAVRPPGREPRAAGRVIAVTMDSRTSGRRTDGARPPS